MALSRGAVDGPRLEALSLLLANVAEEMGVALRRSAFSTNVVDRLDYSCVVCSKQPELLAQAAHLPVHLGSMDTAVAAALEAFPDLGPDDACLLNDPYRGGSHLPDLTQVTGVRLESGRRPVWFVASRAHHADVGGAAPGSLAPARDLVAEGLVVPPVLLVKGGRVQRDVLELVCANVRDAAARRADLLAQWAANRRGVECAVLLAERLGPRRIQAQASALLDATERGARSAFRAIGPGTWKAVDEMEDDGAGNGPFRIRLAVTLTRRGGMRFDFTGTDDQAPGSINAPLAVTRSACLYVARCLAGGAVHSMNGGLARVVRVVAPEGCLVRPRPGAPVAGGNIETSQRIVDVALAALGKAVPDRVPAGSAGTMSNLGLGGTRTDGRAWAHYETLGGGMGAGRDGGGLSGIQTHMTNTRNTPIEVLEGTAPVVVERLSLRRGSGGKGARRGGEGIVKELRFTAAATVSVLADRHAAGPKGAAGGGSGRPGAVHLLRGGRTRRVASKTVLDVRAGDIIRLTSPGGGGWGS